MKSKIKHRRTRKSDLLGNREYREQKKFNKTIIGILKDIKEYIVVLIRNYHLTSLCHICKIMPYSVAIKVTLMNICDIFRTMPDT